jgi:putative glutamine amidotransferase
MTPVIGISCSTLVLPDLRSSPRFALARYYTSCVVEAGGLPLLLPSLEPEAAAAFLTRIDGLILSGGLDVDPALYGQEPHPRLGVVDEPRDAFELELSRGAREQGMPVFAICRGIQIVNVAFGGTLFQHVPDQVPGAVKHDQEGLTDDGLGHSIEIVPGTRLHAAAGTEKARVNSLHHQAVDAVAPGFQVSARAADGVVEAMEDRGQPFFVGVQWHPERRPFDPLTRGLFRDFVAAARVAARAGA